MPRQKKNNSESINENTAITLTASKKTRQRLSQTLCPSMKIEEALVVPQAIKDNFAGQPTAPIMLAEACNISPSSSNWRTITGASIAYGLTEGGYNSKEISLTQLGERVVSPLKEGDDELALKEAILRPKILSDFYRQYNNNKLPKTEIAYNVLQNKGIPKDKLELTWDILRANATRTNILRVIRGNEYIYIDSSEVTSTENNELSDEFSAETNTDMNVPEEVLEKMNIPASPKTEIKIGKNIKPNIFISHGKNNTIIVNQLKELLTYGQMNPVVSVETIQFGGESDLYLFQILLVLYGYLCEFHCIRGNLFTIVASFSMI